MSTATEELTREELQKIWDEEAAGDTPAVDTSPEPSATRSGKAVTQQDDGGQPAAEEQDGAQQAADTQDPGAKPEAQDPMAEINAKLSRLDALDRLEQRVRNTEGHIGGLTSTLNAFREELKAAASVAAASAPGAAPSKQQISAAAGSLAKWESLKSDFPEWADAIDERLGAMSAPSPAVDVAALRKQMETELTAKIRADVEAAFEPRLVDITHRGWRSLVRTPEFVQWINAQPENVRQLAASPKADDAIDLLDLYKGANKVNPKTAEEITAERKARLRQAANVPRGQGAATPRRSIDDMTDEEYWQYLATQGVKS